MRVRAADRVEECAVAVVAGTRPRAEGRRLREEGGGPDEHERALAETQRAFDGVASIYDEANVSNSILSAMRRRSRGMLEQFVPRGARLLDLGCGPGTDALSFVGSGYHVTAVDWSPAMVAEARQRVRSAGIDDRIRIQHVGIHELDRLAPAVFDAAYSGFGPLNCVPDLRSAARGIASRIKPEGYLVASVIGRVCPWEIALYSLRGSWRRAIVRFSRRPVPVPLEGGTVWTTYYTPREFTAIFESAGFTRVHVRALSLFAPPPYVDAFAARHPALSARLRQIDDAVGSWPVFRAAGDHFVIALRRR